jgi:hypothetical protein
VLEYFPEIYPDELLYSVLGRLKCHYGTTSGRRLMIDAFGRDNVKVGAFLQTDLWRLAANIPPPHGITASQLAMENTLLPYVTAYQPQEVRDWAKALLTTDHQRATALCFWYGMTGGDVRLPSTLRYCQTCRENMLNQCGELYWQRVHQLPGVLVCPIHGVPLADSLVSLNQKGLQEYVAADEYNCPPSPLPPVWANQPDLIRLLMDIAQASASLLTSPPPARPVAAWGEEIQSALRSRGFGCGRFGIDQPVLSDAFLSLLGPLFDIIPNAAPGRWLLKITRRHFKPFAPLRHILIRRLIESVPLHLATNPFGPGPWSCRNALANHFGEPVVMECELHKTTRGKTIGVFRCSCGFVFGTAPDSGSRARILDRSQLFEPKLRELVAAGTSLIDTARVLNVTSGAVLYYVAKFGVKSNWKVSSIDHETPSIDRDSLRATMRGAWTSEHGAAPDLTRTQLRRRIPTVYQWLQENDNEWLKMQPPIGITPTFKPSLVDWRAIDAEMVETLKRGAAWLLAQNPPKRITVNALERAIGRRGQLKRLHHLPLSAEVLSELLETVEESQCRRIVWAAEDLRRQGQPISLRRLCDLAGVKWRCAPVIKNLLRKTAVL